MFFSCLTKEGNQNYHNWNHTKVTQVPRICYHGSVCKGKSTSLHSLLLNNLKFRHHHCLAYGQDSSPWRTPGKVQSKSQHCTLAGFVQLLLPHPVFHLYRKDEDKVHYFIVSTSYYLSVNWTRITLGQNWEFTDLQGFVCLFQCKHY